MRLVAIIISAWSLFAQSPMTNQDIVKLARSGASEQSIISAINSAPPRFDLTPGAMDAMTRAGVSDVIIRAMAARQSGRQSAITPAVTHAEQQPAAPRVSLSSPDHWGMLYGQPEIAIGGGASYLLSDFDLGEDTPDIALGVFSLDGAIGFNRYLAGIGSFTRHSRGSVRGCLGNNCAEIGASLTELLGGVKFSFPNGSRFTPFATGLLGGARIHAEAEGIEIEGEFAGRRFSGSNPKLSIWNPAGALGVGVDIHANRNLGMRFETRFLRTIDAGWFGRAQFSVFYRFGR